MYKNVKSVLDYNSHMLSEGHMSQNSGEVKGEFLVKSQYMYIYRGQLCKFYQQYSKHCNASLIGSDTVSRSSECYVTGKVIVPPSQRKTVEWTLLCDHFLVLQIDFTLTKSFLSAFI
jgi:hypothetical protein